MWIRAIGPVLGSLPAVAHLQDRLANRLVAHDSPGEPLLEDNFCQQLQRPRRPLLQKVSGALEGQFHKRLLKTTLKQVASSALQARLDTTYLTRRSQRSAGHCLLEAIVQALSNRTNRTLTPPPLQFTDGEQEPLDDKYVGNQKEEGLLDRETC